MDLDRLVALSEQETVPVIRTDFSDDAAWAAVLAAVTAPSDFGEGAPGDEAGDDGYEPNLAPVVDPGFAGATPEAIAEAAVVRRGQVGYLLLADAQSMAETGPGQDPTLVWVDLVAEDDDELGGDYGRAFRCMASEVASIEANLSIANMDFHEFADYADEHRGGTFVGFADGS